MNATFELVSRPYSAKKGKLFPDRLTGFLCTASLISLGCAFPALANAAAAESSNSGGDIIVTARKRQESILKVPVILTAVSDQELDNVAITNVTELPKLVPGLIIAGNLLSIGPQVTLRGVGTSSFDPGVDQSVSLNIDGLSLGQGLAFGSAMFDVAQVEVLKGPQALFFGKSSPGGVISLRTADPTDEVEVIARGGYEVEARTTRGELIASGPLTETLGVRIATLYSHSDGYFKNNAIPAPGTGAAAPRFKRDPHSRSFVIRGTLLWKPIDNFSARLKVTHAFDRQINQELKQLANCPDGPGQAFAPFPPFFPDPIPFIGGDDCKFDRIAPQVFLDPASFPGVPNDGVPFLRNNQNYGTLELNYEDIIPDVTLTSLTAYYRLRSRSSVNPTLTTAAAPTFGVTNRFSRREFTEELRLNSNYSGPLNFTLGGFFEDGRLFDRVAFIRNLSFGFISPAFLGVDILNDDRATTVDIRTYSLFGQLRYKFNEQLELAAGVRWNDETRKERVIDFRNGVDPAVRLSLCPPGGAVQLPNGTDITGCLPSPRVSSSNFSPEATITYTPTDDITAFGSYKRGFKSGSFKVAVPAVPGEDNAFNDEKVQGYEVGLKSRWLDRNLLANIAFYDYYFKGLQVGGIADSIGGVPVITTVNAGKARSYGIDFDVAYHPPAIEGLKLNASVNWNRARYKRLDNIPCLANQTFAQGCNTFFIPVVNQANPRPGAIQRDGVFGFFAAQDLSRTQMIRAPEWSINFGFDYERPVGSGMKLRLTSNNQFSSKFPSFLANGRPSRPGSSLPDNFQASYWKLDASIALLAEDDLWEVAVIGTNLTDKLTASNCSASNTAGGILLPFGGANTGGAFPGPLGFAENLCFPDGPGRAVWLRLTVRPFS